MNKKTRRGFTIVELVIVIAVIAILAAVLIPTFASVIKKANLSADQQAVATMNKQLAAMDAADDIDTLADAILALSDENLDIKDYKPLTKDHYFYFTVIDNTPTILLADKDNNVIFPESAKEIDPNNWFSLTGDNMPTEKVDIVDNKAVVNNGAQLAYVIENAKTENVSTVTLNSDVNLRGAGVDFGKVTSDLTIDGGNKSLAGARSDTNAVTGSGEYANSDYGFGFVPYVAAGTTVTIKDVTLDGLFTGNTAGTHSEGANTAGLIAGYVYGTLVLDNVTIKNSTVYGHQKVGAIVGQILGGTVILEDVTFENVTVTGHTEVAAIAGIVDKNTAGKAGEIIFKGTTTTNGITVSSIAKGQFKKSELIAKGLTINGNENNTFVITESTAYNPYCDGLIFGATTTDWAWVKSAAYASIGWKDRDIISGYDKQIKINGYTDSKSSF